MASINEIFDSNVQLEPVPAPIHDLLVFFRLAKPHSSVDEYNDLKRSLNSFLDELHLHYWSGKTKQYSDEHTGQQIFQLEVKKKDVKNHIRIQFLGARKTIERLFSSLESRIQQNQVVMHPGLYNFGHHSLIDLISLMEDWSKRVDRTDILYSTARNRNRATIEFWHASKDFLYDDRHTKSLGSSVYRPTSVFLIRQALESRLKGILGIYKILDKEGSIQKLEFKLFVDLLKENSEQIYLPSPLSIIEKINRWSNYYVHGGIEPYLWQIDWARHVLSPLFAGGSYKGISSIYGSVRLTRSLYDEIPNLIDKKFKKMDWYYFRPSSPEVILVDGIDELEA